MAQSLADSTRPATAVKLRIPGQRDEARGDVGGVPRAKLEEFGFRKVEVKDAVRVEATRALSDGVILDAATGEIVELTLEGGVRLFLPAAEAVDRLPGTATRSATRPDEIEISSVLPLDAAERRVGQWVIEGLRLVGVDLPAMGAVAIASAVDKKLVPQPGLHRWRDGKTLTPIDGTLPVGDKPWLLFLHGTMSNTVGSFGGLSAEPNGALWSLLAEKYGDRILALEHYTLTESPIENALQVSEHLPPRAVLHLVSHSRGGLIGELLCRGNLVRSDGSNQSPAGFDDTDFAQFTGEYHSSQHHALEQLRDRLAEKQPKIARFVRVACPARGTTLASGRLDRWMNAMLAALGLAAGRVPALGEIYDAAQAMVLAVVKERTDPRIIPGLEAMIPDSPLIKILNRPNLKSDADLSVIKGDCEASGVLRRLVIWFADEFYGEDHDLVVNTPAMVAGIIRVTAREFFDQGVAVDHFHYFTNLRTAERVVGGLLRGDADLGGFETFIPGEPRGMPVLRSRTNDRRPIVFVVPGITGNYLASGGHRIWIDPPRLAFGGMQDLAIDRPSVTADQLVELYYADLCAFLDQTHEVRPWPYDWRLPIRQTAASFAAELRPALEAGDRPVRIVAHSTGGLVTRTAMLDAEIWSRFKSRDGARLVMLGTPNGGSYATPLMLLGRNKLMRQLAALDLKLKRGEQLAIVSRWPGILQTLPADFDDVFEADWWAGLPREDLDDRWVPPSKEDLSAAKEFRDAYRQAPLDSDCMLYLTGQADTLDGVEIDRAAPAGERIRFTRTSEGDGQVTWKSGIPQGIRAWYARAGHGDLARHQPVFQALGELLAQGTTTHLPAEPPAALRGRTRPLPIAREEVPIHPLAEDLALAGLGGVPSAVSRARVSNIRVLVTLGHLAFAKHPVMVGHYEGDMLAGTEALLDQALDGRLETRQRMGLYPGPVGSTTVVLDERKRPRGAVVVGLGEAGNLDPGTLERALYRGLAAYVAAEQDRRIAARVEAGTPLGISALLVGSGEGGLPRPACVQALLSAADRLQEMLTETQPERLSLASLQIVEAVEYRAMEIWHDVDELLTGSPELGSGFELAVGLERERGAVRTLSGETGPSWWMPLEIRMDKSAGGERTLSFVSAAGRARAEASLLDANLAFVQRFVGQAIGGSGGDGSRVTPSRALFGLLWPVRLKSQSGGDRNLRLILDKDTAALPWELMDDRAPLEEGGRKASGGLKPYAARSGMIRQLIETRFREVVLPPRGPRKALVVGDPRGEPAFGFAELPGAQDEARAVAAELRQNDYTVTELIGAGIAPEQVVMHLFAEDWDVIHIAAHGVFDEQLPQPNGSKTQQKHTGIVLGGDLVLGPSVLAQLSATPNLVFVNCCHQGHIDPAAEARAAERAQHGRRPELAAGVAVELIQLGVRGVVVAGWAVDDAAAERFATRFYDQFLNGAEFGRAALEARKAAYDLQPYGATWGAYQCYGEPQWRLRPRNPAAPKYEFFFPSEAIYSLEQLGEELNTGLARDLVGKRVQVETIQQQVEERGWGNDPFLLAALATVFAELGDLDRAVAIYDRALESSRGGAPIRVIEQRANLKARAAVLAFKVGVRSDPNPAAAVAAIIKARAAAVAAITEARESVEVLAKLAGDTSERWSLRGSCWKRQAQIEQGPARDDALQKMAECYTQAMSLANTSGFFYPQLQWAAAGIARRGLHGGALPSKLRSAVEEIAKMSGDPHDFWRDIAGTDAKVLSVVLKGSIPREEEFKLLEPYRDAWRFGGSPLKLMSVLDQFSFFEDVLADAPPETKPLAEALGRMRSTLESDLRSSSRSGPV
jgi:tetratricopeptide (TPR) repeat protein/triacylglycerol esterase/lipase EstA (alpha/beta hydrolase family)